MLSCELQKRQWAIPAEPEIFSQIVICLFLHADICDINVLQYVIGRDDFFKTFRTQNHVHVLSRETHWSA